ncbi:PstS family phosphate ABC transporter substrate-binding protein [Pseudoalteromonas sp. Angola-18]|jgi:ABC-type phosphate transport system substrate-binding protein|uniref:PstS family phosphate ABC transporter substrate-binding protein n=1 Tax=Pseudoalteromonas sp. Angola-18 TaxID=3025338 RepID=UPI002358FDFF|nr:substrate-binding domain-containing protein [Pseudoalteromonas sp. Angola-18]MDC9502360.1 substrate-binding domain-containing protein [Pseudoalteromonas sp. Angola-18]|tara:strand:- start:300 stop:1232 length:933 start_codon:yes stop_codon:yes gene_type:complete
MIKNLILAATVLLSSSNIATSVSDIAPDHKPLLIGGSSSVSHLLHLLKPNYEEQTNTAMQVRSMGSTKGIKAIAQNIIDIGTASRYLTNAEQEQYPHVRQIVIAQDALVFFTNKKNNIDSLSVEQLSDIYAGKYKTWQEVNPNYKPETQRDNKILLFSKAYNHGTFDILLEFLNLSFMRVPNGNTIKLKQAGNHGLFPKMEVQMYDEFNQALGIVQRMPNAIAFDSYGAVSQLLGSKKINKINLLGINGVNVSDETIKNGEYTFVRPLILLVNSQSSRSVEQIEVLLNLLKDKRVLDTLSAHHYSMLEVE